MKPIVSRANPVFKLLRNLTRTARARREQGRTLLDGPHLIRAYLEAVGKPVLAAVDTRAMQKREVRDLLAMLGSTEVLCFAPELFAQIASVESPAGIVALIEIPKPPSGIPKGEFLVMLDRVQDPGNVGTIIRSAAASGANAVLLCPGCADPWSPRALRAAMGATFAVEIRTGVELVVVAKRFHGRIIATSARAGVPPYAADLTGRIALLLGSEGQGLGAELGLAAAMTVTIPLARNIESLSVGAAAAVIMFERARQRAARQSC